MIIDCHGHYTTSPKQLVEWRNAQIDAKGDRSQMTDPDGPSFTDDEIRESLLDKQIKTQLDRGERARGRQRDARGERERRRSTAHNLPGRRGRSLRSVDSGNKILVENLVLDPNSETNK